jgi:hypothetical protein
MKPFNVLRVGLLLLVFLVPVERASGGSIINGSFAQVTGDPSNPFVGWTTKYGDPPTAGGGFAVFTESANSAFVELEQTFQISIGVTAIAFDFKIASLAAPSPNSVPDSFQATLYDGSNQPYPLPADPLLPAFFSADIGGGQFYNSSYVSVAALPGNWFHVTLFNLSGLSRPQDVTLEFLLNGSDDGQTSVVDLTNVEALVSTVPEPTTFVMAVTGLFCVAGCGWLRVKKIA